MIFGRGKRTIERILVVEDEPLVAFDNEHFLAEAGYQVVATVDRVDEALRLIESAAPLHLILLDIGLSDGGDGLDVARAAGAAGIPVLYVTGQCPEGAGDHAVGCLGKPYRPGALVAAIGAVDALLAGRRPRRVPAALRLFRRADGG